MEEDHDNWTELFPELKQPQGHLLSESDMADTINGIVLGEEGGQAKGDDDDEVDEDYAPSEASYNDEEEDDLMYGGDTTAAETAREDAEDIMNGWFL